MLSELLYKAGRIVIGSYARMMLKLDVHWHDPLPEGPVLYAANHPSTTDPIFIHLISRQPISVMINSKIFTIPVLGAYMRKMRQIEVIRGQGTKRQSSEAGRSHVSCGSFRCDFSGRRDQPGGWICPRPLWCGAAGSAKWCAGGSDWDTSA